MLGALFAVPTAAAAYAIGPSDRVFSGFWGIGFNFWPILTSRLSYIGVLGEFALFTVIFFYPRGQSSLTDPSGPKRLYRPNA